MYNDAKASVAEILGLDTLTGREDLALDRIEGWDSLRTVRLVIRLEELVGRELSETDIDTLRTVGDVTRLLAATNP
jgi:acyl carrier protein